MHPLVIGGFVVGGFIAAVLVVLGLRGRFGTARQQGDYELYEIEHSSEVPHGARTARATCRGHDGERHQLIGAGVLWATDDEIGFVLRTPRRHLRVRRSHIGSAIATDHFARPGLTERADGDRLLVITWDDPNEGTVTIVFDADDAAGWAADLNPDG